MNILLTGGSGFIGRNVLESFQEEYKILAPTRSELNLLSEEDVRRYLDSHAIDTIIHSAVKPGHRNATETSNLLDANTRMFFNLARSSNYYNRMIFLSSGAVYDTSQSIMKFKESDFDKLVPKDEHGFSKYITAKYIEKVPHITELRLFGVFGKYEDYAIRFISNAICKTIFDLPITLRQNRKFDYIYINDFIKILQQFILNPPREKVYNVTPDTAIDLQDIAKIIKEISGKNIPIQIREMGLGKEYSGDNSRIRNEIPYNMITNIGNNIEHLYQWYQDNQAHIDKSVLLYDK